MNANGFPYPYISLQKQEKIRSKKTITFEVEKADKAGAKGNKMENAGVGFLP